MVPVVLYYVHGYSEPHPHALEALRVRDTHTYTPSSTSRSAFCSKASGKVVSYLTPLTGLREGLLDDGEPLDSVLAEVKSVLGPDVVLVD